MYLGYKISANGVHTAKIKTVWDFARSTSIQGVRQFLGRTNYCRYKFVENYAKIAFPLNRLLDKPDPLPEFTWSEHSAF